ncbi:hypothetical protein BCR44DRAFT_149054 [Catenaria anguillulae PL171]|uniref:Probable lysosomal cobalamin transporter n=1 Tax=Catenaria anguillulae PL171 TaxID=765915 RepID=A0A1Y2HJ69_9FUNG|nr:hypothetical protein BCR44DRAFT_149054 [Catenaria anguillulae PL171]
MPPPRELTGTALTLSIVAFGFYLLASTLLVRKFSHVREREPLISTTTVLGLTFALTIATCTLPVDVLLVSSSTDPRLGRKYPWADPQTMAALATIMSWVYDMSFLALLIFCCAVVPFVYFYFEENDDELSTRRRVSLATRHMMATTIILAILMACGLLLRPASSLPPNTPVDWDFLKKALLRGGFETALLFVLTISMMAGLCVFLVYTSSGLFLFPIYLLKPVQSFDTEIRALSRELHDVQGSLENMLLEFPDQTAMTSRDQRRLDRLHDAERFIQRKMERVQASQPAWYSKTLALVFLPVKLVCLAISVCVVVAIMCTILTSPPSCPSCPRLVVPIASPANPIDMLLQVFSRAYPLDHFLFALILLYLLACTLHGVRVLGVRILWIKMFSLRSGRTMPQGLLLAAVFLILTMLSLMWEMTSVLAPSYATWGSQRYCPVVDRAMCEKDPWLVRFCELSASTDVCTPTSLALIVSRIALGTPVFSAVFYYVQYGSVVVSVLALIYGVFSARQSRAADLREDDSDDDELDADDEHEHSVNERTRLLRNGNGGASRPQAGRG